MESELKRVGITRRLIRERYKRELPDGLTTTGMYALKRHSTCWTESCSVISGIGPEGATTIWVTGKLCHFISKPLENVIGSSLAPSLRRLPVIFALSDTLKSEGTDSYEGKQIRLILSGLNI